MMCFFFSLHSLLPLNCFFSPATFFPSLSFWTNQPSDLSLPVCFRSGGFKNCLSPECRGLFCLTVGDRVGCLWGLTSRSLCSSLTGILEMVCSMEQDKSFAPSPQPHFYKIFSPSTMPYVPTLVQRLLYLSRGWVLFSLGWLRECSCLTVGWLLLHPIVWHLLLPWPSWSMGWVG